VSRWRRHRRKSGNILKTFDSNVTLSNYASMPLLGLLDPEDASLKKEGFRGISKGCLKTAFERNAKSWRH
jgi:hypothetical protein